MFKWLREIKEDIRKLDSAVYGLEANVAYIKTVIGKGANISVHYCEKCNHRTVQEGTPPFLRCLNCGYEYQLVLNRAKRVPTDSANIKTDN